ncbi:MAG: ABC transporter permease [Anaerolineae bacterium]|nr:ABC transporter permease [Anaerolineae bacterium]MCO5190292.1 ABC transporter permease [Anaerolineae bacterium]
MNIYKHELKMKIGSVIGWSIAVFAIIFIFMAMFSAIAEDAELLNETLASMPEQLLQAFGMTGIDMATVLGFFGFAFTFCQICIAIQAANYGFSLVSVEETDMTADFLLPKPVSRSRILTSKLLAALTALTITNVVVWVSSFLAISMFRDGRPYDSQALILLLAGVLLFQLVFLTVGVVVSLFMKRVRNVTPYTMALVFGAYILNAFGGMLGEDTIELITPFKHFDPNYVLGNAGYDVPLVLISVVLVLVSIVGSYRLYTRRNIQTAM